MSAYHYFCDFFYCDSDMISWLLILEVFSKSGKTLSDLMKAGMECYLCSGEINSKVKDTDEVLQRIEANTPREEELRKLMDCP